MKKIYVAGAYSANNVMDVLHNISRGIEYSAFLLKEGNAHFCPWLDYHFALVNRNISKQLFYEYSIAFLEVCDEVHVLEGSENSVGTQKEIARAKELNIPIIILPRSEDKK